MRVGRSGKAGRERRVAVIGAGAAGSISAIFAASAGAEILLIERMKDGGRKILMSGGGRCNILPISVDESRFVTDSSRHTLRKILRSWSLEEQIVFFERDVGVPLVQESESGKRFPASERARDVRDGLRTLALSRGVRFLPGARVTALKPLDGSWRIHTEGGPSFEADAVILATGGMSVPKTGSDGGGLKIAENLGHTVHPVYPALTPLTARGSPFLGLAGVSPRVAITATGGAGSASATGGLLFTHEGYSGPAVLDVSHVAVRSLSSGTERARLAVRWSALDEGAWEGMLSAGGKRTVASALRRELPARLANVLVDLAGVDPARPLAHLEREERGRLVGVLARCDLPWTGHGGYAEAEVTGGGVSLAEIDPRTMESRRHPGLFLCGEMLDAFGPIGGHNLLWAWVTGRAAGLGARAGLGGAIEQ